MSSEGKRWTIKVCSVCGRDDRYRPFTGKFHWVGSTRCENKNVEDIEVVPAVKAKVERQP